MVKIHLAVCLANQDITLPVGLNTVGARSMVARMAPEFISTSYGER
jgi:hypothetical protein